MKIEAVIVVYNRDLENSPSYSSLLLSGVGITVCDNSISVTRNEEKAKSDGVRYLDMNGNAGLPRAYNRAFDSLSDVSDDTLICLFDDDTEIPSGYFSAIADAVEKNPDAVAFLPVVREADNGLIMSPCRIKGCRVSRADDPFAVSANELTGINSGLAIRSATARKFKYNEKLFLDYADHDYIRRLRKSGAELAVFDSPLIQHFSRSGNVSRKSAEKRFNLFKKDFTVFCSGGSLADRIYCKLYLLRRKAQIARMPADNDHGEE